MDALDVGDVGWHVAWSSQRTQSCLSWDGLGSHQRHWRRSSSSPARAEWPGEGFVFQSSPRAVSQGQACTRCLTWHGPSLRRLTWFKCFALNKTLSKKQGVSKGFLLLPQIPLVCTPLKHASSQMPYPVLSLYSQRKLLAAFFGVSFSWLRPSHANKDLFFSDQNNIKEKILSHD